MLTLNTYCGERNSMEIPSPMTNVIFQHGFPSPEQLRFNPFPKIIPFSRSNDFLLSGVPSLAPGNFSTDV